MIRRIKRWLRRWCDDVEIPASAPEWTRDDTASMRVFLASPTGQKFVTTMRGLIVHHALMAVSQPTERQAWACGRAEGFGDLARWVDGLTEQDTTEDGGEDDRPDESLAWLGTTK